MSAHVIRSRSSHPFALVKVIRDRSSIGSDPAGQPVIIPGDVRDVRLVGYAASDGPKVQARARRLVARIVPIVDGRVVVDV